MTYSMLARDPATGEMGLASASQAFAVGSSVTFAEAGAGVIATQSMAEPLYGQLGLDLLRAGLTATEALTSLRSIDPHPERRQVAMIDGSDDLAVYTGDACVEIAGHLTGAHCCALGNLAASTAVWEEMIDTFQSVDGTLSQRLMCALEAGEGAGGDIRGRRSAALLVVRAQRTGRPWRDQVTDLRVDHSEDPVSALRRLVEASDRYHRTVIAFETALDGDPRSALDQVRRLEPVDAAIDPDQALWRATILALAGEEDRAARTLRHLGREAPAFLEAARRFISAGLLVDAHALARVLALARE